MIQANELRIGNLLYPNEENKTPYPVLEIREDSFLAHSAMFNWQQDTFVYYKDATPIPLTPEILEKCGFEKGAYDGDSKYFLKLRNGITSYEFAFFPNTDLGNGYSAAILLHKDDMIGGNIYYLHQLQNLYFALTGKELTVKL